MLQRGGFDGATFRGFGSLLKSGSGASDALKVGAPLVSSLFGTRQTGLTDWIASAAGIRPQSSASLLGIAVTALQPVNMNEGVREVVDLARSEVMSRRITVTSTLMPDIPLVLGDRIQLQQVVLNLILNACDAMSETLVAKRQISLATTWEGSFVQLVVSDRGVGIANEQLEHVFEPFVTFRDQGLGLGLAISRSIVSTHRGSIRAENNVEGGATFRCFLPVADARAVQSDLELDGLQGAKLVGMAGFEPATP